MTWRRAAGLLLLAHALAHTLPGMHAAAGFAWLPTLAWGLAVAGFLGAGSGLLGARAFRARWDRWAAAGVLGSGYLLVGDGATPLGQLGLTADAAVLLLIAHRGEWVTDERVHPSRRVLNVESIAAVLAVALLTGLVLARPWFMRWGSTTSELQATWPGDELVLDANYLSQHAVTIRAPPSAVWPWLAQLGQNRAGFYSYAWLENLFGLGVRNADRIHPEWQEIRAGDSVYATPPGWLSMHRRLGWRVVRAERDRVLMLENWGAFILEPRDGVTRLIMRTRGSGSDSPLNLALAPLGLLVFEPAHFIMQRKMLLELKRRAEAAATKIAENP